LRERKILKTYGGGCHQKLGVSYISLRFPFDVSPGGDPLMVIILELG
jgi:hypothetical protein